jgi:uncharacterized protein (TIGR00369 family)
MNELSLDPDLADAIKQRRSVYGRASGLELDRLERGEAWSRLPPRPQFIGDAAARRVHGGVMTAMLDESCGMAVQAALDGKQSIATLDLRIDYLKPADSSREIRAHSVCYAVTRSIAFVRATAFHDAETDPIATATSCFMIGANDTNLLDRPASYPDQPALETIDNLDSTFTNSPFAQCINIGVGENGIVTMPFSPKIVGNWLLPAIHGGIIGAFLETASIFEIERSLDKSTSPKPIGLTVNYLRSGRARNCFAKASIVRQGRRVVAFEARAWQEDPERPIASAYGHFMLRQPD